jgi:class 3 adenylate cyclase/tetratricopeptide (TPR) repeat protein
MKVCPRCGEQNSERARFCQNCGYPFPEHEPVGEERKTVTVVFCDLVGFTARSDHADPEDVKATLRPYHARLKREIERFGGTLDKFVGDGVMAVFGAPAIHEDDPRRALLTALRIQEAISELNAANPAAAPLSVRIGVATGEAVVAFGAGPQIGEAVTGDVVNTASRIQSAAPVDGIAVEDATYEITKEDFDFEEMGPAALKGKAEPLRLWRVLGARARLGVGVDLQERPTVPFVDRVEELSILQAAFRRAVREQSAQLVTVTGEPGIGKSRLVVELRSYLDDIPDLLRWRQGRCLPYGESIAFWALGEIVKAHAGILESDSPEEAAGRLRVAVEAAVADPAEVDWLHARLAPLAGFGGGVDVDRAESFAAWRRFLEALASEYPLVLVFEDLHWGDQALLEFIDHLVDWARGVPLLVVCAARPELFDRFPTWGGGKRNSTTLPLSPLTENELAQVLVGQLDGVVLPAETQGSLIERAGGNPLYAEEFVRILTDKGLLGGTQRWGLAPVDSSAVPIPETVQAMVAARLDALPPERKALLHDAAVIGNVFWCGALASMSARPMDEVRSDLMDLSRRELVRPSRSSTVAGDFEFSFWHLLVRDVAYAQIPRSTRGAKHRAAAEWGERVAGDRLADRAEVLAVHYQRALEYAQAAGSESAEERTALEDGARRFLLMAGDRALGMDVSRAFDHFERALQLTPPDHPDRPVVLAGRADAFRWHTGNLAEVEAAYDEAIAAFRASGDVLRAGDAMVHLSNLLWVRGEAIRCRRILAEAIELLEQAPPGPEVVGAYTEMARDEWLSGKGRDALDWCRRALALAEAVGSTRDRVRALGYLGAARSELGEEEGLQDLRRALTQSLEAGLGREAAVIYDNLASQLEQYESATAGLEAFREAIEFASRRGMNESLTFSRSTMLRPLFALGRWDELVRVADEIITWASDHGAAYLAAVAKIRKAHVLALRGATGEAASLVEGFLPTARAIGEPHVLVPALVVAAIVEESAGTMPGALDRIHEALAVLEDRSDWDRAQHVQSIVRIALACGDADAAHRAVAGLEASGTLHRFGLEAANAALAEHDGRWEQALASYRAGAANWERYGFVLERGLALLGEGRTLMSRGRARDAEPPLAAAADLFRGLGADALAASADRERSRTEAPAR